MKCRCMDLCNPCAQRLEAGYDVRLLHRHEWPARITCTECGKQTTGGTYMVTVRKAASGE